MVLLLAAACRIETRVPASDAEASVDEVVELTSSTVEAPPPPSEVVPDDPAVPGVAPPAAPLPPAVCPYAPDPGLLDGCLGGAALSDGRLVPSLGAAASQAAVEIVVCPGIWDGGIVLPAGVALVAADPTPGVTVIVGPSDRPAVTTTGSASLRGLTLHGGEASRGAAISASGDLDLECMEVRGGRSDGDGGGVSSDGRVVARWSRFVDNVAGASGGAVWAWGGVEVTDSVFEGNSADQGGAISTTGWVDLERAELTDNEANSGGAIDSSPYTGEPIHLTDVTFSGNQARQGGALWSRSWTLARITADRVVFTGNTAEVGAGAVEVAGDLGARVVFRDVAFSFNEGGAVGGLGLTGWLQPGGSVGLQRVSFDDGRGGVAGALWVSSLAGEVRVNASDLRMWRNEGSDGAASLRETDQFSCAPCDFGTGADDNVPTDATFGEISEGALPASF